MVERHLGRATITTGHITVELATEDASKIVAPFVTSAPLEKKIVRTPAIVGAISDETRLTLLTTIARSRRWVDGVTSGSTVGFAAIARDEKLVERHVLFLAPLAFLSPRIVEAIAVGRAPRGITVSGLARNLPLAWSDQEHRFGLSSDAA